MAVPSPSRRSVSSIRGVNRTWQTSSKLLPDALLCQDDKGVGVAGGVLELLLVEGSRLSHGAGRGES